MKKCSKCGDYVLDEAQGCTSCSVTDDRASWWTRFALARVVAPGALIGASASLYFNDAIGFGAFAVSTVAAVVASNLFFRVLKRRIASPTAPKAPGTNAMLWGPLDPELVCPECQLAGDVRTKLVPRTIDVHDAAKAGLPVSGTAVVIKIGGDAPLVTQAHCDNCNRTWRF